MAAKYQEDVEQITSGVGELRLPESRSSHSVRVLSWNIYGLGHVEARRKMIGSVVKHIKPDVLLLQETENISSVASSLNCPQAKDGKEAQILYNSTFEEVSQVNLDEILEKMFPANQTANQLRSGSVPDKAVIKMRMCAVRLRHKRTKREIIFVSYHNIRKGGGKGAVKDKATQVCEIIAKISESSKCCVIAGVDFNCYDFNRALVTVPDYKVTPRRQRKSTVDFFILDRSTPSLEFSVKALDLFPREEKEPFYKEFRRLLSYHTQGEYDKAIDHDPLILSWSSS